MTIAPFSIARLPRIEFGTGRLNSLPALASPFGRRMVLVTGAASFSNSAPWSSLKRELEAAGFRWHHVRVADEPSPEMVDGAVQQLAGEAVDVVVGIGGGSVLDAAKAIAGLLPHGNTVMDHLEGVGRGLPYEGPATPFIAVPTTAGTGSEATKNAVLSRRGRDGFKKSFRHDSLVPEYAIIDPSLLTTCPPAQIAANGMDAFTQLLESYVSTRANPFTDALAWSGMAAAHCGLWDAWRGGNTPQAEQGRAAMAYAALLSGITLAQAGLGSVHGLAAPLGARFPIPHGVACGALLAAATAVNISALQRREPHSPALPKYARVGRLLAADPALEDGAAREALIEVLGSWTQQLEIPRLGAYGVDAQQFPAIVADSGGNSMKTNPIVLTDGEITEILQACC